VRRRWGCKSGVLNGGTDRKIDAAFASFEHERPDALFVGSGTLFNGRRVQLTQWAAHHRIPASYAGREYVEAGGLMSYASNTTDAYRQSGAYVGRILKGAKPVDLPVVQSTKFELVINAQTARMLGLTVPDKLLALADEVIE
jgi:putative tryptophan/tyrosine transport system substrate-binding protein